MQLGRIQLKMLSYAHREYYKKYKTIYHCVDIGDPIVYNGSVVVVFTFYPLRKECVFIVVSGSMSGDNIKLFSY